MALLRNGDLFPRIEIPAIGGDTLSLPGSPTSPFHVVLIYRGAWCPFCTAQLAGFAAEKATLDELGVEVTAFSVDDEATTAALAAKLNLKFRLGHSATADRIGALTGAFINSEPKYLQPTAFTLTSQGTVMAAVYSSQAVGRLAAPDFVKFLSFMKSKMTAQSHAAA